MPREPRDGVVLRGSGGGGARRVNLVGVKGSGASVVEALDVPLNDGGVAIFRHDSPALDVVEADVFARLHQGG